MRRRLRLRLLLSHVIFFNLGFLSSSAMLSSAISTYSSLLQSQLIPRRRRHLYVLQSRTLVRLVRSLRRSHVAVVHLDRFEKWDILLHLALARVRCLHSP